MVIDANTVIIFGSVVGVVLSIGGLFVKVHRWIIRQEEQDNKITDLKEKLEEKITAVDNKYESKINECSTRHDFNIDKILKDDNKEFAEIKVELKLLTYSVLACLKGMRDGAQDPRRNDCINDAINTIEKHINEQAHS